MSALSLLALVASAATQSPPPVIASSIATARIIDFRGGEVRCGGVAAHPVQADDPLPFGTTYLPPNFSIEPIRLRFRIDETGRPLGIRREAEGPRMPVDSRDLLPALATWRFAPGPERRDCQIRFEPVVYAIEEAPLPLLHRYLALSRPNAPGFNLMVGRAAFERAKPEGSDCFDPPPGLRQRVYPAYEDIEQPPGTFSYAFLHFDIDADGRPTAVRVASSSGNPELDRRAVDAVERSRFAPRPRRGCNYAYVSHSRKATAPPESPEVQAYRPEGSNCPLLAERPWAHLPALVFPPEFNRRQIEGWAIVTYDLAPWGAVGNAAVAAAEPAAPFGEQAQRMVSAARAPESAHGYRGCVTRFQFRVHPGGEQEEARD